MGDNKSAAEMVDRKEGYYWVKFNSDSKWQVAKWNGYNGMYNWWTFIGTEWNYTTNEIYEIDERQICRS